MQINMDMNLFGLFLVFFCCQASAIQFSAFPRTVLLTRTTTHHVEELRNVLFPSMQLYWPADFGELVIALDAESDVNLANEINANTSWINAQSPIPVSAVLEQLPSDYKHVFPGLMRTSGYDRQQWSNFYCEKLVHLDVKWVGIIDTDTEFFAPVVPSTISMDGERLRTIGRRNGRVLSGRKVGDGTQAWSRGTEMALNTTGQLATFMINFPVWYHKDTFYKARQHIAQHEDFDSVFSRIARVEGFYSQFNILGNYIYLFEHDRYDFHIQCNDGAVDPRDAVPAVRVARHTPREHLLTGCCLSILMQDGELNVEEKCDGLAYYGDMKYYYPAQLQYYGDDQLWTDIYDSPFDTLFRYQQELREQLIAHPHRKDKCYAALGL